MSKKCFRIIGLMCLVVMLASTILMAACAAPAPAPAPKPTPAPTLAPTPATDIAKIKEAAIKEGELNWVDIVVVPDSAKVIMAEFKKYYGLPDSFKVTHERTGSGVIAKRVQDELKADKITMDVLAVADPVLFADMKKAGALLKYDSPEYKYYAKAREYGLTYDPGYWQSCIAYTFAPITNEKTYPKKITSWMDLLSPDLKGQKIDWPTPASAQTPLYTYIALKTVLPMSFFTDLAKQETTTGLNSVQQTQKLAQGEVLVTITNPFRIVQTAGQTGVNLTAWFPKEGSPLLGHPYGILAKGKHPNAAKLFIDFLFSEKGTKLYIDTENIIPCRDGAIVPDKIKAFSPPLAELKAIKMDWTKYDAAALEKNREESTQIFGK